MPRVIIYQGYYIPIYYISGLMYPGIYNKGTIIYYDIGTYSDLSETASLFKILY